MKGHILTQMNQHSTHIQQRSHYLNYLLNMHQHMSADAWEHHSQTVLNIFIIQFVQ